MATQQVIRLSEVLQQMDAATEPFQISFVTANKRKKEGGIIENYPACLSTGSKAPGERKPASVKPLNEVNSVLKNPNHFRNATRNLLLFPSKQIRKVHIWLILTYNGQKVII
jgi:hypothetical protein